MWHSAVSNKPLLLLEVLPLLFTLHHALYVWFQDEYMPNISLHDGLILSHQLLRSALIDISSFCVVSGCPSSDRHPCFCCCCCLHPLHTPRTPTSVTPPGYKTSGTGAGATVACGSGQYRADWKPANQATQCLSCGDNVYADKTDILKVYDMLSPRAAPTNIMITTSADDCCE